MSTQPRNRSNPPLIAWGVAVLGALLAVASGVAGLALSFRSTAQDVYERVASALASADFTQARQILTEASNPAPLDGWVYSERESLTRSLRSSTARDLILLLEQSRSPKLSTFSATLGRVERAIENLAESSTTIGEKWSALSPTVATLSEIWERLEKLSAEFEGLNREDLQGTIAFAQLSNRFANALGLPFDDRAPTQPKLPQLYSSGVLKDLPVLPQIPEGVTDLPALKSVLGKVGGQVMYSGPTAFEDFTGELNSLKALSRKVADDYSSRGKVREELSARKEQMRIQRDGVVPRFFTLCTDLALSLTAENWTPPEV